VQFSKLNFVLFENIIEMGRKDKQPQSLSGSQSGSRQYVQWNTDMDKALAAVLYDQLAQGNKEDGHWKDPTYQVAMEYINTQLNLNLTKENIKNRLKAWKLHFAIITDIKNQSGLTWDEDRKMVVVTADNLPVWNDYVKVCFILMWIPIFYFFLKYV
jgi:hypothetical protein